MQIDLRLRLSFQKLFQTHSTCRNYEKHVWEKSNDAYSLSIRVQTTINHISICFLPQYQCQRKWFFSEHKLKKALDTSSVVWTLVSNGKLANQIARLAAIVVKYIISVHVYEANQKLVLMQRQ